MYQAWSPSRVVCILFVEVDARNHLSDQPRSANGLIGNHPETINLLFPSHPARCHTPARVPPVGSSTSLARLYLHNILSSLTAMDSEVRRTLLEAPSTSVSAALVRPLDSNPRNTEDCATNVKFLLCFLSPFRHCFCPRTHGIVNLRAA